MLKEGKLMEYYTNKQLYEFHQKFYQFLIDEIIKKYDTTCYYWTQIFKEKKFYEFIKLNEISIERLPESCLHTECFCCGNIARVIGKYKCLLKFKGTCRGDVLSCLGRLYLDFLVTIDEKKVIKILRKIKNLPLREENE